MAHDQLIIDMHPILVLVKSVSEQLVGNGSSKNDSRSALLWTQKNEQLKTIAGSTATAVDIARLSVPAE